MGTQLNVFAPCDRYEESRDRVLEKYGLEELNLIWPDQTQQSAVDYIRKNPSSIAEMYGQADLSKLPIFQGGFINFGYWPESSKLEKNCSTEQRIRCSKNLYELIGDLAGISKQHTVLDVGCGLGYGTAFCLEKYEADFVVGLDISPQQIIRAKTHHSENILTDKLRFTLGEAESFPFPRQSFDRVISVEAAQHFSSMTLFAKEASRVLKPQGKLVVTSFFARNEEGIEALNALIPNYPIHGSQLTIEKVKSEISKSIKNVKVQSIGNQVWRGLSKWLDQIGYQRQWSKIWEALYERDLIDYVIYEATLDA